jgi:hypothetical protein
MMSAYAQTTMRHMIEIMRYGFVHDYETESGETFEHDANDRHAVGNDVGNGPDLGARHYLLGSRHRGVH